jgi:hypothetical protein
MRALGCASKPNLERPVQLILKRAPVGLNQVDYDVLENGVASSSTRTASSALLRRRCRLSRKKQTLRRIVMRGPVLPYAIET